MTHAAEIQRILKGIGWPIKTYDFDPPYDFQDMDVCQLISGTSDGFPEMDSQKKTDVACNISSRNVAYLLQLNYG